MDPLQIRIWNAATCPCDRTLGGSPLRVQSQLQRHAGVVGKIGGHVAIGFVLRFLDDEDGHHGFGTVGRLASVSGFDFVRIDHILQDLHHGFQHDARQILSDCVVCSLITLNLDCHYYNSQSTHKPFIQPACIGTLPPGGRLTSAEQGRFWRSGARRDCQWDTAVLDRKSSTRSGTIARRA